MACFVSEAVVAPDCTHALHQAPKQFQGVTRTACNLSAYSMIPIEQMLCALLPLTKLLQPAVSAL